MQFEPVVQQIHLVAARATATWRRRDFRLAGRGMDLSRNGGLRSGGGCVGQSTPQLIRRRIGRGEPAGSELRPTVLQSVGDQYPAPGNSARRRAESRKRGRRRAMRPYDLDVGTRTGRSGEILARRTARTPSNGHVRDIESGKATRDLFGVD